MASNYTENYGLCQWEATDHVLRRNLIRIMQRLIRPWGLESKRCADCCGKL